MTFFADIAISQFTTTQVVGYWNLNGYSDFNLQILFNGPAGARAYPHVSFNNVIGYREETVISGGFGLVVRTIPVYAPDVSLVIYNPSAPMTAKVRIYAACCAGEVSFWKMLKFPIAQEHRILSTRDVQVEKLEGFRPPEG